jgi:hypothetical protein
MEFSGLNLTGKPTKRMQSIKEINQIAEENGLNKGTLVMLFALTSDKGMTKLLEDLRRNYPKKKV